MKTSTCNFTLKTLLLLMLLCLSNKAFAYDFEDDEFCYKVTSDSTVMIAKCLYVAFDWLHPEGDWEYTDSWLQEYENNYMSRDIVIPSKVYGYTVTAIGDSAFYGSSAFCVTIPETVTVIGNSAFKGCPLSFVISKAIDPPIINDSFYSERINLFVYADAYSSYKSINDHYHYFKSIHITDGERTNSSIGVHYLSQVIDNSYNVYGCILYSDSSEFILDVVYDMRGWGSKASESSICNSISKYGNGTNLVYKYVNDGYCTHRQVVIFGYALSEGKSPCFFSQYFGPFERMYGQYFEFMDSDFSYNSLDEDNVEVTFRGFEIPCGTKKNVFDLESIQGLHSVTNYNDYYDYYDWIDEMFYYSGNVEIPTMAINLSYDHFPPSNCLVTAIGRGAFKDCDHLRNISIPLTITSIGDDAFKNCSGLTSITIPASISSIGCNAFEGCISLDTLNFNAVSCADFKTDFSERQPPFLDLNISTINIEDGVQRIPDYFACGLSKLKNIDIPNTVKYIGKEAFSWCSSFTSITVPDSVETIGFSAFHGCYNLEIVTIGKSVSSIDKSAFDHCGSLKKITFRGSIPPIIVDDDFGEGFDEEVMQNATLYVPISAIEAYRSAPVWGQFQHIVGLYDYDFEQNGAFFKKVSDNEVALTIGENAYSGSVTVPTEVTYQGVTYAVTAIGDGAFADASLTSLSLPVTITSVGAGAFEGCVIQSLYITGSGEWTAGAIGAEVTNLYVGSEVSGIKGLQVNPTKIYSYAAVPPICDEQTFLGYNAELHVPASSLAAYFTAPYWCNFTNIVGDAVELIALSLDKTSIEALVGSMVTLTATLDPNEAVPNEIIWTTSNESVATVEDGMVTLTGPGECDIMAACQSKMAVCHVTATVIMATEVILSQESAKLEIGSSLTLTATVIPDDATYKAVTWATTDSTVAVVSDGVITAIGTGECFIIASCGECQAMCRVIVVEHLIYITLDEHDVDLLPNHIITLTPSITPVSTDLVVTSRDPSVAAARLANGLIQVVGVKEGSAMITLNSADGYAEPDSCLVTVYTEIGDVNSDGFVNVTDVTTLISQVTLAEGSEFFLENADVNYDGVVNITDVTLLINYIMGTGSLKPKDLQPVEYIVNGVKFNMMRVRGGTFNMGATVEMDSDANANESPVHQVTLSSYYIGQTEVTQELWQAVMGSNPSNYTGDLQRPVEKVSYNDCQLFITQLNDLTGLNFRLPTEAEWEYAARGGRKSHNYRYAGSNDIGEVAWFIDNSDGTTHPVATKKANELGIYDMSGNVCEWCGEWFSLYPEDPQINPVGPETGKSIVHRGGSLQFLEKNCAVTRRNYFSPGIVRSYMGFRLVL